MKKNVWFLEFPTSKYNEDVKALARKADVRIIDARFKSDFSPEVIAERVPKVTLKKDIKAEESKDTEAKE